MAGTRPFVRFLKRAEGAEPEALVGFSLPFLPDMLTSRWLSRSSPQERLEEALKLQIRLISQCWGSGVAAWDLRFVGTESLPGVAIGLLCRLSPPPQFPSHRISDYCQDRATFIQQLFADFGYEVSPLTDEASLLRYLSPFRFQALGEIRRHEELLALEDAYTRYEVYVPYPWLWTSQSRLRLFEALLQRQADCLVSVCLEPTQLGIHEQRHLNHATSQQIRDLLTSSGPKGTMVYNIYCDYAHSLSRQPYLVRVGLAASTYPTLEQIAGRLRDELSASQIVEPTKRAILNELYMAQSSGTSPILVVPRNREEWERAHSSLFYLTWVPWGHNEGVALPGTARLRYLVDDIAASMAFRLPVARYGDIPGVPVRSLAPTTRSSSGSLTPSPVPPPLLPALQTSRTLSTDTVRNIQRPEELIGMTLGTCQIEALLGQGGFGAVYRARQAVLNRYVAVKVILATLSNIDAEKRHEMSLRFDHEAQAIARLDHLHILTLYEYQPGPLPYLVMPYITGGSLADERAASGYRPLPASGVATILQQVASALDHAHQQHLIHRDIKPHNLLRHQDGRILLSDFGIAQFVGENHIALTTAGEHSPYTPAYASPEQLQGLALDHRSDIYSLGVVIYELLAGQGLFPGLLQHLEAPPSILQKFGVPVSQAIEAVVAKALAKQPAQRYQSTGEMATAFQAALL